MNGPYLVEKGQDIQEQMGNRVASDLQNRIHLIESLTTTLANLGETLAPDISVYKQIVPHILDYENREPFIAGGGIWPGPYQFDPQLERCSFFWGREPNGSLKYYDDYNDPQGSGYHHEEWYVPATYYKPGEAYWSKSYMDPYSHQSMVTCTVPMWRQGQVVGVATVDLKLEGLKDVLSEASKTLGGYMFVVDRNNKFLSFPDSGKVIHTYKDDGGNTTKEYFTARDFAEADPRFAPIADALETINLRVMDSVEASQQDFERLVNQIAEQSYQINEDDAKNIVAAMLSPSESLAAETMETSRLFLDHTTLLEEPVMVSIFMVPQTNWKIVAVTPMSKFYASADAATWKVGTYVMGFEMAGLLIMFLLIRRTLIKPLRSLSYQIRQTSEHGQQLHLHLDENAPGELGRLAYEFNCRTDHLVDTLDELQKGRDQLEDRVSQRTADLKNSEAEIAVALQELKNQKLATDEHSIVSVVDVRGKIIYVNDKFCKLSGYTREELIGQNHRILKSNEHSCEFYRNLWKTVSSGNIWHGEIKNKAKDGSYYWVDGTIVPFKEGSGRIARHVAVRTDITAIKAAQDRLRTAAERDRLTNLPNRELFTKRLYEVFQLAQDNPSHKFAVMFFDFDRFKIINDGLGHTVGDALLIDIARQFEQSLREGDIAARFGGDEFIVLLNGLTDYAEASETANRLLELFAKPHSIMGHEVVSTASIGLITNEQSRTVAEDMIRDADVAMYQAKESGKNQVAIFDLAMHSKATDRLTLENDLRLALPDDQMRLYYQPIIELETGELTGFESLIRWEHPDRGIVSPIDFIPIAEDTGLIIDIGRWVFQTAVQQITDWNQRLCPNHPLSVNINVSKRQLLHPNFMDEIVEYQREHGLPRGTLKIEITESIISDNRSNIAPLLHKLREIGFPIVMDDFGTGVSSLSTLHNYPIDILKIDQAFIRVLDGDRSLLAVVSAITTLAENMGIKTVAEGVESADIIGALQSIDCTWGQGYHFAKPLTAADAEAYILGMDENKRSA